MIEIRQERLLDYTPEQVWAVLADFPNVYQWAPMVTTSRQVSVDARGDGAARSCSVPGFGELTEQVDRWTEGQGFSYLWDASGPVKGGRSTWSLVREDSGTRVTVVIDAEMRYGLLGQVIGQTVLKSQMNRLMADTLRGLEHFLATGEVVDRDVAKRLGLKAA